MEYDLLTKTGHEIDDIGRTLSWGALDSFIENVDLNSALGREASPEYADFASDLKRNWLLADISDQLAMINTNLIRLGHGKPGRPALQPRPQKDKKQKWDVMSADDFDAWLSDRGG